MRLNFKNEYFVIKEESSIKIENRNDSVNNIIEEKSLLPSEIRKINIIEKIFNKVSSIIKYIFS